LGRRLQSTLPVRILGGAVVLLLAETHAVAQDSHYWTQEYGSRAELLGGVVAGSLVDLGAAYYNPGTLALVEDPDNIITSLTFQMENLKILDPDSPGEGLSTTSLRSAPSLFAGRLPWRWENGRFAYSMLVRQEFRTTIKSRFGATGDFLTSSPEEDLLVGETFNRQDVSEMWAGLTWSRRLSEHTGFGISQFFTYFGQSTRLQNLVQITSPSGEGGAVTLIDDFDFWTLGILWKIGLGFDFDPWTFGISFTTPKLTYYGTGKALYLRSLIGLDLDGNGQPDSQLEADLQKDLGARHRSPFAIAIGGSYSFGNAAVHFSSEWFAPVERYTAVDAQLEGSVGGVTLNRLITQELQDVVNAGIGFEYRFNERWAYYGSFRTDFSATIEGSETSLSLTTWNLYHISSGMRFSVGSLGATLGAAFAFGGDDLPQRIDFSTISDENLPLGERGLLEADYLRMRFILGFSF
jgi:hypothetical protein